MITDPDRFRQDKSPYERPNFPYRCGRLSFWGKPCGRGPSSDGACGGVSECSPYMSNGRWECRRSVRNGGPCEDGPLPDGKCCKQHAACKPIPSLRRFRGRLTLLAAALVLALISAFGFMGDDARAISSVNPGEISGAHSKFSSGEGCATCHKPHGQDAANWLKASWSPASMSESCESCHTFSGPASAPHNETFQKASAGAERQTECTMCHTEHKGESGAIIKLADAQCNACHEQKFDSFSNGHPPFSETYPSRRRTVIAFNHTNHFNKHFEDQRFADRAPKDRCVACHDTDRAGRNVPVKSFEQTCAGCHENQIAGREFVVFTLPEFEENPFEPAAVREACGPSVADLDAASDIFDNVADALVADDTVGIERSMKKLRSRLGLDEDADAEDEYESVSLDFLPATAVMLLGIKDGEDMEEYTEPVRDLVQAMIDEGGAAFEAAVEGRKVAANELFAGLSSDLVHRLGCAWASNVEYESPADPVAGGWYADALSLGYLPVRHADPVAKAWVELAAAGGEGISDDMRDTMIDGSNGAGACTKCHSVNADPENSETLHIGWKLGAESKQRHVTYTHVPHLNLLGLGQACETCHKMDQEADFAAAFKQYDPTKFASNFKSIEDKTCIGCHAEGQVRQECTLCHEYHNGHGFKHRMSATGTDGKTGGPMAN